MAPVYSVGRNAKRMLRQFLNKVEFQARDAFYKDEAMASKIDTPISENSVASLFHGDRNTLARAITIVENSLEDRKKILKAIANRLGQAYVVGISGPPGVGKSTLVDACIKELRQRGQTVAVLTVDPSSRIGGGAVLGDRVRMAQHTEDDGVFIRSVAARGHLGGLSATAMYIVNLFDATGWDIVLVETVGVGQSEMEISALADTVVVVEAPGMGDDIQAMKSGILEIADIVVLNKSDLPNAQLAAGHLRQSVSLRPSSKNPKVIGTAATLGNGITKLVDEIICLHKPERQDASDSPMPARLRQSISKVIGQQIEKQLAEADDDAIAELIVRVNSGDIEIEVLVQQIIRQLLDFAQKA